MDRHHLQLLLIVYLMGTAYAWAGGDWLGGIAISVPPVLAIIAMLRK